MVKYEKLDEEEYCMGDVWRSNPYYSFLISV
jgi:hypothetical protein